MFCSNVELLIRLRKTTCFKSIIISITALLPFSEVTKLIGFSPRGGRLHLINHDVATSCQYSNWVICSGQILQRPKIASLCHLLNLSTETARNFVGVNPSKLLIAPLGIT